MGQAFLFIDTVIVSFFVVVFLPSSIALGQSTENTANANSRRNHADTKALLMIDWAEKAFRLQKEGDYSWLTNNTYPEEGIEYYYWMMPNYWGPAAWFFLHSITLSLPEIVPQEKQSSLRRLMYELQFLLPCPNCSAHLMEHMQVHPVEPHLGSREQMVQWMIDLHNAVNTEKGKPAWSRDTVMLKFNQEYGMMYNLSRLKQMPIPTAPIKLENLQDCLPRPPPMRNQPFPNGIWPGFARPSYCYTPPKYWASQTWFFMFTITLGMQEKAKQITKDSLKAFMHDLPRILPCRVCGEHLVEKLQELPVELHLGSHDEIVQYMIDVAKLLSKDERCSSIWSREEALRDIADAHSVKTHARATGSSNGVQVAALVQLPSPNLVFSVSSIPIALFIGLLAGSGVTFFVLRFHIVPSLWPRGGPWRISVAKQH